jgi:hypothetical protein
MQSDPCKKKKKHLDAERVHVGPEREHRARGGAGDGGHDARPRDGPGVRDAERAGAVLLERQLRVLVDPAPHAELPPRELRRARRVQELPRQRCRCHRRSDRTQEEETAVFD